MTATVLGRITGKHDRPRGPDAQMSVFVPLAWIEAGVTLEIALPRNLACASCHGGGCDRCERSGAVSLRSRKAAAEVVEVTLPSRGTLQESSGPGEDRRSVVVRIPERGGLPEKGDEDLPRGNLLISILPGAEASRGVTRLKTPSVPAPPVVPEILQGAELPPEVHPGPRPLSRALYVALALVVAALVAWMLRR